jgi:hypothetical protein
MHFGHHNRPIRNLNRNVLAYLQIEHHWPRSPGIFEVNRRIKIICAMVDELLLPRYSRNTEFG